MFLLFLFLELLPAKPSERFWAPLILNFLNAWAVSTRDRKKDGFDAIIIIISTTTGFLTYHSLISNYEFYRPPTIDYGFY